MEDTWIESPDYCSHECEDFDDDRPDFDDDEEVPPWEMPPDVQ
jgi:hypothetical protein